MIGGKLIGGNGSKLCERGKWRDAGWQYLILKFKMAFSLKIKPNTRNRNAWMLWSVNLFIFFPFIFKISVLSLFNTLCDGVELNKRIKLREEKKLLKKNNAFKCKFTIFPPTCLVLFFFLPGSDV